MLFCEPLFLFAFLPLVVATYYLLPRACQNAFLCIASVVFYATGETRFLGWLAASILVNYVLARVIESRRKLPSGRVFLALGIASDLGLLAVFKYGAFLVANANQALAWFGGRPLHIPHLALPIGISFFTFHKISYKIDVYRGTAAARRGLSELLLYILLFPQLIAGPIIRYHDIANELRERNTTWIDVRSGVERFVIGLAKKLLLADSFALVADHIFGVQGSIQGVLAADLTTAVAWTAALAYTLQIYFDFSGYSDMAVGLGRMFGFHFPENFNYPYVSRSITEFWRRWHISLSRWFRDYLYIPLGGSRGSSFMNYRNLVIVFLLCGLWHGANWTFVIWGLGHGAFLVGERMGLSAWMSRRWRPWQHVYTLTVVVVGWVVFRAETLGQASVFLQAMAGFPARSAALSARWWLSLSVCVTAAVGALGAMPLLVKMSRRFAPAEAPAPPLWFLAGRFMAFALLLFCTVATLAGQIYSPFIYYRF